MDFKFAGSISVKNITIGNDIDFIRIL